MLKHCYGVKFGDFFTQLFYGIVSKQQHAHQPQIWYSTYCIDTFLSTPMDKDTSNHRKLCIPSNAAQFFHVNQSSSCIHPYQQSGIQPIHLDSIFYLCSYSNCNYFCFLHQIIHSANLSIQHRKASNQKQLHVFNLRINLCITNNKLSSTFYMIQTVMATSCKCGI